MYIPFLSRAVSVGSSGGGKVSSGSTSSSSGSTAGKSTGSTGSSSSSSGSTAGKSTGSTTSGSSEEEGTGSSASSGSTSGKSSGSSSSSSSAKTITSGSGSSSTTKSITTLPGYSSKISPQTATTFTRSNIYSYPGSYYAGGSTLYYGYGRPINGIYPVYGFWPWYWYTDTTDNSGQNDTRPGGPLTLFGISLPNNQSSTYILYGDQQSVDSIIDIVLNATGCINVTLPSDTSGNQTIQDYRDQSFMLLKLNPLAPPDSNSTFLSTLNSTIGDNLIIAASAGFMVVPNILLAGLATIVTGLTVLR